MIKTVTSESQQVKDLFKWTDHPVMLIPTDQFIIDRGWGHEELIQYHEMREEAILMEKLDPYRNGYELRQWGVADDILNQGYNELLIQGGNRSSKTEYCAKRVIQALMHNPESIIWCFQTTFENSVQMQQKAIYKYLPNEFKSTKRGKIQYISYNQKNGFSAGKFVLPNKSECIFRHYSQGIETIEGGEIGCMHPLDSIEDLPFVHNIGFWADELIPQDFLDTLRYRLVTRNSKGIISFTAVEGYTPVVRGYMIGAKTEKEKEADLIPGTMVPIIQQPKREDAKILYFHTADNPYGGFERIKETLRSANKDEILCRAYGVPEKPMAGKFPKFSHKYNVVKHDRIPFIKNKRVSATFYHVIDPAGSKPWFMLWAGVTEMDEIYIFAEYPDISYGMWADMSKGTKGRSGEAARPNGFGIKDYIEIMDDIEGDLTIFERLIDPRLGAAQYQKEEMATSIIDELLAENIQCIPAPGYDIEEGLQSINDWLSWNDKELMTLGNRPKVYISEQCENLIYSMTEYTDMGGKNEPTKDPIDCMRYLATAEIGHIDEGNANKLITKRY